EGNIYVTSIVDSSFLRSRNSGKTWDTLAISNIVLAVATPYCIDSNGVLLFAIPFGGFIYSSDQGNSWRGSSINGNNPSVASLACTRGGNIYLALGGDGPAYHSTDDGHSWSTIGSLRDTSSYPFGYGMFV